MYDVAADNLTVPTSMLPLTPALLKSCMPRAEMAKCEAWADPLNDAMGAYGMNTIERVAGFLGSVRNETGDLHEVDEMGWFRTPWDHAKGMFGHACPSREDYEGRKTTMSEAAWNEWFFNHVYDDRIRGRGWEIGGNVHDGDGNKYRGRGVGLTGRGLYEAAGVAVGADFVNNPDLLFEPKWAALSIAWLWQRAKNNERLDRGDAFGAYLALNRGLKDYVINANHMVFYYHVRGVLVQAHLLAAGFDPQGIDGALGKRSFAALDAFRHARGLPVAGGLDAAAVAALARAA